MTKKLTSVDKKRCQAERITGSFMTLGPRRFVQCENKPAWIATEKQPNKEDGLIGSMSMCDKCKAIFLSIKGRNYASFNKIR